VTYFFWFLSILGGMAAVRFYVLRHPGLTKDPDSGLEHLVGIVGSFLIGAFLTRTSFFLLAICWMLFSK
jgi:hypothetical protein